MKTDKSKKIKQWWWIQNIKLTLKVIIYVLVIILSMIIFDRYFLTQLLEQYHPLP